MNNSVGEEKKSKKILKLIKIVFAIIVLMVMAAIGLAVYSSYLKGQEFKVNIDGKSMPTLTTSDVFIISGNNVKVKIKDIAPYLGKYEYRNGLYGDKYNENKSNCYLISENEVVSFENESSVIEKSILNESVDGKSSNQNVSTSYEKFDIKEAVSVINDSIYTNLTGISIGCNVQASYDADTNTLNIYTLDYLTQYYSKMVEQSAVMDEDVLFSNKKAAKYGLIVVKDEKENYGVNDINNQVIIGEKYKTVKFVESTNEFIVKTQDNKMGIISIEDDEGKTKITPIYDNITEIDEELYLVRNNNKYGMINNKNQIIVPVEYDSVGLEQLQVTNYEIKNRYMLYEDYIPVKKDKLWGLINKSTKEVIIVPTYDDLGCASSISSEHVAQNLLLVPEYDAIIVEKDGKYGMINTSGKIIIQPGADGFYMTQSEEEITYYVVVNGQELNLIESLKEANQQPVH